MIASAIWKNPARKLPLGYFLLAASSRNWVCSMRLCRNYHELDGVEFSLHKLDVQMVPAGGSAC